MMKVAISIWAYLLAVGGAFAQGIELPSLISDHAVLQADQSIPVWGTGPPQAQITVQLGELETNVRSDREGQFHAILPALPASFQARDLRVSAPDGSVAIRKDILIGEVWLAAGQSNMVWELEDAVGGRAESISSNDPYLRVFEVPEQVSLSPQDDVASRWVPVPPRSARRFSAVGYYFGKQLRARLDAPVGIIQTAYGGTRIEAWVSEQVLAEAEVFKDAKAEWDDLLEGGLAARQEWFETVRTLDTRATDRSLDPPIWPDRTLSKNAPAVLYNAMLAPALKVPTRGLIWYQGESNRAAGEQYRAMLGAFISMLRDVRGPAYPVGIVQIAPVAREVDFPTIWNAQLKAAQDHERVGLIVTTDLAELEDIHPRRKEEVGERLGHWALADAYGHSDGPVMGPLFKSVQQAEDQLILSFDPAVPLTTLHDAPLTGFVIETLHDSMVVPEAKIQNERVILSVPTDVDACAISYEMQASAFPVLTNETGIPASPFREVLSEC